MEVLKKLYKHESDAKDHYEVLVRLARNSARSNQVISTLKL